MKFLLALFALICVTAPSVLAKGPDAGPGDSICPENVREEYESLEKDVFSEDFSLVECMDFLSQYGDSVYGDKVSDLISLYYLNILSPSSDEKDFNAALSYARTDSVVVYASERIKEMKREARSTRIRHAWTGRLRFGVGLEYAMWRNTAAGFKIELCLGSRDDILNVSAGIGTLFWNMHWTRNDGYPYISFWQYPVYLSAKLNLFNIKGYPVYCGFGAAYNFPDILPKYSGYDGSYDIIDDNSVSGYLSLTGKIGIRTGPVEFSLFCVYDTDSPFNLPMLQNYDEVMFESLAPAVYDRFRIGLDIMLYFTL